MKINRSLSHYLLKTTIFFLLYLISSELSTLWQPNGSALSPLWVPSGLGLAFLFMNGIEYWPGIFVGTYVCKSLVNCGPLLSLGLGIAATLSSVIGAIFLKRLSFNNKLVSLRDVVSLVVVSFIGSTFSAFLSVASLCLVKFITQNQFYSYFITWLNSDTMGDIVCGSCIFILSSKSISEKRPWKFLEGSAASIFFLWIALSLFFRAPDARAPFPMTYFIFPSLLWIAIRFGQLGSVLASTSLYLIGFCATAYGFGPFMASSTRVDIFQFQLFIGITTTTTLVVAALASQTKDIIHIRDEFLSIASHELKTPLTSLQLHFHLLTRMTDPKFASITNHEKVKQTLAKASTQVDRITNLVNDLLDVTRIQAGKLNFRFEKVNLLRLMEEVLERFSEQLALARCKLEVNICEDIVGFWDPIKIEQIIVNLVTNAIKYAPGRPIVISAMTGDRNVYLTVQDFGPGINKESQQRIFDRFERVTNSQNIGGLGLGLFISRQIAEAHRGKIHVVSELGKGARFILDLPLNPA